jgi:metal-responsive CopG/Arc/MetJ family transcriptional regulator
MGMKTAVSVPAEVYEQAEELAQRTGRTRSEIYSTALRDYLAHHEADPVTAAMDRVLSEVDPDADPFLDAAAQETLAEAEW